MSRRALFVLMTLLLAASGVSSRTGAAAPVGAFPPGQDVTEVRTVDGHAVLFQYGRPVPSFLPVDETNPHRVTLSLDGEWAFTPLPSSATPAWRTVQVPHVWDLEPDLETFEGPAWYKKHFNLPRLTNPARFRLVFLGAADEATVYVNGQRAGYHRGAYAPFALDITPWAIPGEENEVVVELRRRPWGSVERHLLPPNDHDWWLYGGLFRSVYLEIIPQLSVARILVGYRSGTMESVVVVQNEGDTERRIVVRFDPGWEDGSSLLQKEITVEPRSTAAVSLLLDVDPGKLWRPESPRTYTARAQLADADTGQSIDVLAEHYGLVDVAVSGTQLTLSGKPLFIKGVNWHTDDPEVGAAYSLEHFRRDFDLMRAAGANLVRFSHYPRHPQAYRLTDQKGLMVIDEAPNYWMDRLSFIRQLDDGLSKTYVQRMVWDHVNHPSIILWSILNESETSVRGGTVARRFITELVEAVRELDLSKRPVTYASHHHRDDIGFPMVDVIGINEYFGFFYGTHRDLGPLLDFLHGRYPDKPILITEIGDWAVYGSSRQSTQLLTFLEHWRQMAERSDFVAGGVWWVFADHKSRHQPASAIPYISTMGMVDRQRRPKRIFEVFKGAPFPETDDEIPDDELPR